MIKKTCGTILIFTLLLAGCKEPSEADEPVIETIALEKQSDTEVESDVSNITSRLEKLEVSTISEENYEILTETYEQGEIRIQYPQIVGLSDEKKQEAINELIRNDLIKTQVDDVLEGLENDYCEDIFHLDLEYDIKMQSAEILSILYTGTSLIETLYDETYSTYYSQEIDAITINMKTAEKLKLTDFIDVDEELVRRIKDCKDYTNGAISDEEEKEALLPVIQEECADFIIDGLTDCWGPYQFCVSPDALLISIGTVHAGGDYILFTLKCDSPLKIRHISAIQE